ncbi:MAG: ribonuclease P [Archaeoglobaceae archaeon]|nr:ribonuclease P [Archaeoglobaceae archaeon]MDW8127804.1 Rpp14/Pop5 family protein [Archaeoglobaceae archaeon]
MKLPPSMRSRKRYIAFRLISEKSVDEKAIAEAMVRNIATLFGEVSAVECGLKLEKFDGEKGIVRCNLEALEKVMIALTLIDKIGEGNVALLTLGMSGTLRGCKKKLEVLA